MAANRAGGRDRVVRARRPHDDAAAQLAEIDQRLLGVLCAHRVVTQNQLALLFPHVPERTLRYRTRRLHQLGLAGRSRPYREQGSPPNHHWPTRRADCLIRGEPTPRGGERKQPNPMFLAHAAALTDLYVALTTEASAAGLTVQEYRREGDAREAFTHLGKERALAPDAMVIVTDAQGRQFGAFVEIDLGTMSHTRLRQKAELYAAYATSDAWHGRHLFLPALLFLTTTDTRANKFLKALARALSLGPRRTGRHAFVAGAVGVAWAPHRLLTDSCLADLDGNAGLALLDVLNAARAPYEQVLTHQREQDEADEARRRMLRDDPLAMRKHLASNLYALTTYTQALGPAGDQAIQLLAASAGTPSPEERAALRAIARDLDGSLLAPHAHDLPAPGSTARSAISLLTEHYRRSHAEQIETLAARHGDGPSLHHARSILREGELLDRLTLNQLPRDAERDVEGRREQDKLRRHYLESREHAARQLARKAGPLGRLTHRAEDFHDQLDHEHLRICRSCGETIYPAHEPASRRSTAACHYCQETPGTDPYDPTQMASKESEAYP